MLNENILNILSVLYILKKIEAFEKKCYEKAYEDKDNLNLVELNKNVKAAKFRAELSTYVC